jgi:phenylalanyl-tRNA synthetase alpha chain
MTDLEGILHQATQEILSATDLKILDHVRVHYLGKKGLLTDCLKQLGQLSAELRPAAGQKVNQVKEKVASMLDARNNELQNAKITAALAAETIDVTLPGRGAGLGSIHPVTKTRTRISALFSQMGFLTLDGPEIEDDYHNFAALNIPPLHPARAMQDTFYFADQQLLRTHMSPVQIRAMKTMPLPMRIIAMGRVYRRDFDITHTPMFHQIEGLMISDAADVTFAHLKGIITQFLQQFFETDIPIRFRASYFPFTEPSAEVDIGCQNCQSKGCRICKNTGWLEVLGCGMVHPNVFAAVGIDAEKYRGWAFGAGLDRLTMLRYGITDLRALFENDIRFLGQF